MLSLFLTLIECASNLRQNRVRLAVTMQKDNVASASVTKAYDIKDYSRMSYKDKPTNLYVRTGPDDMGAFALFFTESIFAIEPNGTNQVEVDSQNDELKRIKQVFTKEFEDFNNLKIIPAKEKWTEMKNDTNFAKESRFIMEKNGFKVIKAVFYENTKYLILAPGAKIAENFNWHGHVYVGRDSKLGKNVSVGEDTVIGPKTTIEHGAKLESKNIICSKCRIIAHAYKNNIIVMQEGTCFDKSSEHFAYTRKYQK